MHEIMSRTMEVIGKTETFEKNNNNKVVQGWISFHKSMNISTSPNQLFTCTMQHINDIILCIFTARNYSILGLTLVNDSETKSHTLD